MKRRYLLSISPLFPFGLIFSIRESYVAGRPLSKNSPPDCFLIHPLRSALFYFVALKAESDDQRRCLWTPPKEHSPFGIPYIGSAYLLRCKRCTNTIFDIIKRVYERQRGKRSSWLSSKFRFTLSVCYSLNYPYDEVMQRIEDIEEPLCECGMLGLSAVVEHGHAKIS